MQRLPKSLAMFASFTSILSPAIKEKLGIGPKQMAPDPLPPSRPLSPHNRSKTLRPLPQPVVYEVQSPGFASRLTNMVSTGPTLGLAVVPQVRKAQDSPSYSRAGPLPLVRLGQRSPPRLTSKNSTKLGRWRCCLYCSDVSYYYCFCFCSCYNCSYRGRGSPVILRIAPSEPFSPFKRFPERRQEEGREGSSTDPRQVAVTPGVVIHTLSVMFR